MYRIDKLIKLDRKIYHSNDLALLWGITNKNTLYTTIKRYVQKGVLIPIFKGFYATVPVRQLEPLELGKSIVHTYAYVSTESVLAARGLIAQAVYPYTFVTSVSKSVTVDGMQFLYRKLKDPCLYNPLGIENNHGVFVATPERAVADMVYFNPQYHIDLSGHIDWKAVRKIQKEVGYL
jgi:predicted transcriptional regulator of viral defense system